MQAPAGGPAWFMLKLAKDIGITKSELSRISELAKKMTEHEELLQRLSSEFEEQHFVKVGNFPIDLGDQGYVIYTAYCQLGGCEMDPKYFKTFREAVAFALDQTMQGKKVYRSYCLDCYREGLNSEGVYDPAGARVEKEMERLANLKGTGKPFHLLSVKMLYRRPCYDTEWEITVDTSEGIEKIYITRSVYETEESILANLKDCKTIGDIEALNERGIIYYD